MKKLIVYTLISLTIIGVIIFIVWDRRVISHEDGDIVTKDGIVYEFDSTSSDALVYDYENPADLIYHKAYYLDMIHPERYPKIEYSYPSELSDGSIDEKNIVNSKHFAFTIDQIRFQHRDIDDLIPGFFVKSYTDKLKADVEIPDEIDGYPVKGIGYQALKGASFETLVVKSNTNKYKDKDDKSYGFNHFLVMPYAFSDLENVKSIKIERETSYYYTMSFSNSQIDELILSSKGTYLQDAAIYNSIIGYIDLRTLENTYDFKSAVFFGLTMMYPCIYKTTVDEYASTNDLVNIDGNLYRTTYDCWCWVASFKDPTIFYLGSYIAICTGRIEGNPDEVRTYLKIKDNCVLSLYNSDEFKKNIQCVLYELDDSCPYLVEDNNLYYNKPHKDIKIEMFKGNSNIQFIGVNWYI